MSIESPGVGGNSRVGMLAEDALVRFAGVTMDLRAGLLRRGDQALPLRPKSFDVLAYFVQHRGRLIPRLELLTAVWPDVIVTDDSLVQCLVEIRRVLGEHDPITTVRGRGYRFDAPIVVADRESASGGASTAATVESVKEPRFEPSIPAPDRTPATGAPDTRASASPSSRWMIASMFVVLLGLAGWASWRFAASRHASDVGRPLGADSMNREAIRLVDEGRVLTERQTRVSLLQAADRFESATRLDPVFAGAWAGLSKSLTLLHIFGSATSPTVLPRAKAAAQRAISLDPTFAGGHSALAHVLEQYDRDWVAADASHRRAIALDPSDANLHQIYALFLISRLRVHEALAEMDAAQGLAPRTMRTVTLRGIVLMFAGRSEESLAALDEARRAFSPNSLAEYNRALVLADLGRFEDALDAANAARVEAGNEPTLLVGIVHALAGRHAEALEVRRALLQKSDTDYIAPTDFGLLEVALGNDDEAVRWLERAADEHARGVASINVHPLLRRLRGHPGYIALLGRLDLPLPSAR